MPTIGDYMTRDPKTIRHDASVGDARQLMRDYNIRHLIVTSQGELTGIVSQRDLDTIQRGCRLDEAELQVDEAMMPLVYRVPVSAPLGEVTAEMAEKRYGCAIVVDERDRAIGLFTTVDALKALSRLAS